MSARNSGVVVLVLGVVLGALSCSENTPSHPSCTYGVSSVTLTFSSTGGQGTATLNTGSGCSWTAAADSPWVTFPGGSSGSGPATLSFAVAANSASDSRKATLTIAGQPLAITQDGKTPCDYTVSPSALDVVAAGAQASVSVVTSAACEWTIASNSPWVTFASATSGTGSGAIAVLVAPNSATAERQAALSVAGRTVPVRQAGAGSTPPPPPACEYSVSPVDTVLHWHLTSITLNISTGAGCSWTAAPSDAWLGIDKTSGSGPASIAVSFSAFTEDATRRAAIQVRWPTPTAGQNAWVTQEGCRYGVDPAASFPAAGGTRMVTVVTQAVSAGCSIGCPWTATSNASWIRVTSSMPRAGDDAFFYQVEPNTGGARTGTITVAGRTHTVTQAGT
jgi:hypothetical protein